MPSPTSISRSRGQPVAGVARIAPFTAGATRAVVCRASACRRSKIEAQGNRLAVMTTDHTAPTALAVSCPTAVLHPRHGMHRGYGESAGIVYTALYDEAYRSASTCELIGDPDFSP
jgi:hypothetical protein